MANAYFFQIDLKWPKSNQNAHGHPQLSRQAQLWQVEQVQVMFIKNLHDTCLYTIFQ